MFSTVAHYSDSDLSLVSCNRALFPEQGSCWATHAFNPFARSKVLSKHSSFICSTPGPDYVDPLSHISAYKIYNPAHQIV